MKAAFLGIGAQKCASTWLHAILSDHPDVSLPVQKEIDFFSNFYDYGFQWYEKQFAASAARTVCGEVSPSYLHTPGVPQRVYAYNAHMRLILLLRNPIERAESNHRHEVRIGHLVGDDITFERGLANNPSYVEQGLYATHLERWLECFPRQQILVLLVDDIAADACGVARRVYEFLGVRSDHVSRFINERSNESYVNPHRLLERFRKAGRGAARALGLERLWVFAAEAGLRRAYRRLNWRKSESLIPPMRDSTRVRLRGEFSGEILRLEQLLGRSLTHWT